MDRKICLAGFASPSKFWALYQPEDVEIWCMNEGHIFLNRINIVFQVHPRDWREQAKKDSGQDSKIPPNTFARGEGHVQFLQGCPVPVIMQQKFDDIPNCHVFPYEEVYAKYGHYLTSTPAMMLALALLLDDRARAGQTEMLCGMVPRILTEVRISGVELRVGQEYYKERACFEYFLGRAMERGAQFIGPPMGTSILNAPTYALEEGPTMPQTYKGEPIKVYVNVTKDGELRDAGTRATDKAVEDRGGGDAPPDQRAAGGVADGGGDEAA